MTGRIGSPYALGEREVPLVVRGDAHDRARAHVVEHEVRRPDRDPLPAERVDRMQPGEDAELLRAVSANRSSTDRAVCAATNSATPRSSGVPAASAASERVLDGERQVGRAVNRIDARREDLDRGVETLRPRKATFAPRSGPIQLRCMVPHAIRASPAEPVEVVEQLLRRTP